MYKGSLADSLFIELLIVSLILIIQMLYNNLVVYRKKINDNLSVMLIACLVMGLFDHLQVKANGNADARAINYIAAIGYSIALFIVTKRFNQYFMEKLEIKIRSSRVRFLLYKLPLIVIVILLITTPFTRLIFMVDENNAIVYMPCYDYIYNLFLYLYPVSAMVISIYLWIMKYKAKDETSRVARSMIIFVVALVGLYHLQENVLPSITDKYITLAMPISVALVLVTTELSIFSLMKEEKKNARIGADLNTARKIQMDALLVYYPAFPEHPNVNLKAFIKPASEVGGDFYDYFSPDDDHVCFLIADVSGKGIPAALFMMTIKTMIKDYAMNLSDTGEIFTAVNRLICQGNDSGMFATAWIGMIDTRNMTLTYTNAGHNYPLISQNGGKYEILKKKHGLFLAGMDDTIYKSDEISLSPGDRLFLYTDGVVEAHDKSGELYGMDRLKEVLSGFNGSFGAGDPEKVLSDIEYFAGDEPQFDDITIVMIDIK